MSQWQRQDYILLQMLRDAGFSVQLKRHEDEKTGETEFDAWAIGPNGQRFIASSPDEFTTLLELAEQVGIYEAY